MAADRVRVTNDEFFIRRFRESSIMSSPMTMRNVEGCIEILRHMAAFRSDDEEFKSDDDELNEAVKYYMFKIFRDGARKLDSMMGDTYVR